jgi:UDP-N-acetylmuramate--alanine ligase
MDITYKYHFIGIGGIGMSALANILLDKKIKVSGSDLSYTPIIEKLKSKGALISIGHKQENIEEGMVTVYNSMINQGNEELKRAIDLQCPVLHRSDLLKILSQNMELISVSGSHGKTSTSSLLTFVLTHAGFDPSFAVGGLFNEEELNGYGGRGNYFVIEADESDGSFLKYTPFAGIITNIDDDHLDHYQNMDALKSAFKTYANNHQNKNYLFWCKDDKELASLNLEGISYGFHSKADVKCTKCSIKNFKSYFDIDYKGSQYCNIELNIPGKHQVLNATAVFALSLSLGVNEKDIRTAFKLFKGVQRRMQKHSDNDHVLILDDYGHHPTEIEATLKALRHSVQDRRIIAVFQPHRVSRTLAMKDKIGRCFEEADEVIVTDLYAASEPLIEGVDGYLVVKSLHDQSKIPASFVSRDNLTPYLIDKIRPHDVVILFNAGDLYKTAKNLGLYFSSNSPKKLKVTLLSGGKSGEHEISLKSKEFIKSALSTDIYEIEDITIEKNGFSFSSSILSSIEKADIVFPVFHGPFGEDGTVQGFLELFSKAFAGCGISACALSMDKALLKHLAISHGIKTAKFKDFSYGKWVMDKDLILADILENLSFPLFVKPVHLGSSIGVNKAEGIDQLKMYIEYAFNHDNHVLVEEEVIGREIEFSVLGSYDCRVASPGEILTMGKVYDYQSKYGIDSMKAQVPCDLSLDMIEKGKALTKQLFEIIRGSGLCRVDFFLCEDGFYWLNEINPMPGFTSISVYPKAFIADGFNPSFIVDEIIIAGLSRKRRNDRCFSAKR